MATTPPSPPLDLAYRVGALEGTDDPLELYERLGREIHEQICSLLPDGWDWDGKRSLDFGCGAGRTIRHFFEEAERGEVWGCDIDRPSVEWVQENLSPPLHALLNDERPPIDRPDASYDLIWAVSVFTHLTDSWSEWLLEMHRLLDEGGILIATFMGGPMSEWLAGEAWDEDRIGMNVLHGWQSWDEGGPSVLHSSWWVREHWGRAFEVVEIDESPEMEGQLASHHWAVLRKRPGSFTTDDLERLDPGEPREIAALRHNLVQTQNEARVLKAAANGAGEYGALDARAVARAAERYESTLSWRVTRPLRALRRLGRSSG
jgi:SAM-dependent methyltransferase